MVLFQFQKVRLWVDEIIDSAPGVPIFQFQKVRLWGAIRSFKTDRFTSISIPKGAIMRPANIRIFLSVYYFNSKRCDYEIYPSLTNRLWYSFQFQKVRLWGMSIYRFNQCCTISIPKGAIMSLCNRFDLVIIPEFQFQKVRLWETGEGESIA